MKTREIQRKGIKLREALEFYYEKLKDSMMEIKIIVTRFTYQDVKEEVKSSIFIFVFFIYYQRLITLFFSY